MKRLLLLLFAAALFAGCAAEVGTGVDYGYYYGPHPWYHQGPWMYGHGWYHHDTGGRRWGWVHPVR